eukprot:5073275-Pyramimonas_sp.AAC.1
MPVFCTQLKIQRSYRAGTQINGFSMTRRVRLLHREVCYSSRDPQHFVFLKFSLEVLSVFCNSSCHSYRAAPDALRFGPELSYGCEELYEVPSGDQVNGSPPAPVGKKHLNGPLADF